MSIEVIHALAWIKGACAVVNGRRGALDAARARAIDEAAAEVCGGAHDERFPLPVWQPEWATRTNSSVNDVIATLAERRLGPGQRVHPDDVDRGQSPTGIVASAMHVAAVCGLQRKVLPALAALMAKSDPRRGGVELGHARAAIDAVRPALRALAIGADLGAAVCRELAVRSGCAFVAADDRVPAGHEPLLAFHAALKVLAAALTKIDDDDAPSCESPATSCRQDGFEALLIADVLRSERLLADAMTVLEVGCARRIEPARMPVRC